MKKLSLLIFLGLGFLWASAQDNKDEDQISTIFSRGGKNGVYGALSFNYTQVDGKDAFMMGARGSWIIDHSFAIGFGGSGFMNDMNYHMWSNSDQKSNFAGGYGGFYLEPIIAPRLPVHISVPVLLGVGGITNIENQINWIYNDLNSDVFLVLEPTVELEFNMTRHLRLAGTIGYRFTSKIEMQNTNPDILKGTNVGLVIKFGKF